MSSALGLVGPVSVYCDRVRSQSKICNFYLSVEARVTVRADPSLRYTSHVAGTYKRPTNQQPQCPTAVGKKGDIVKGAEWKTRHGNQTPLTSPAPLRASHCDRHNRSDYRVLIAISTNYEAKAGWPRGEKHLSGKRETDGPDSTASPRGNPSPSPSPLKSLFSSPLPSLFTLMATLIHRCDYRFLFTLI